MNGDGCSAFHATVTQCDRFMGSIGPRLHPMCVRAVSEQFQSSWGTHWAPFQSSLIVVRDGIRLGIGSRVQFASNFSARQGSSRWIPVGFQSNCGREGEGLSEREEEFSLKKKRNPETNNKRGNIFVLKWHSERRRFSVGGRKFKNENKNWKNQSNVLRYHLILHGNL